MSDTIMVKARPELGNRTALWERDERHPGGEVFVAGDEPVEVFKTPEVMVRLNPNAKDGGTLVELTGAALADAQAAVKVQAERTQVRREAAQVSAEGADPKKLAALEQRNEKLEKRIAELQERFEQRIAAQPVPDGDGETAVAGAKGRELTPAERETGAAGVVPPPPPAGGEGAPQINPRRAK